MLINKVTLFTPVLKEMKVFYADYLGINLVTEFKNSFELEIGDSVLSFQ